MARLTTPPCPELRWRQPLGDHVIAIGWSTDGSTVAAASVAGPVSLFDVSTGSPKHTLRGHGFGTTALSWHPDDKRLATAGQDGKVRLWDAQSGTEIATLDGGAAWVEHLAWQPKGDYLVSAAGKKLRLWKSDATLAKAYPDSLSTIAGVVWSPRGKEFVAAGYGGVTFFRPDADGPISQFEWKSSILAIAWSPDGNMLAGGGLDATVHFWYVKSGEDLQMAGYPTKGARTFLGFDQPIPGHGRRRSCHCLGLRRQGPGRFDAACVRIARTAAFGRCVSASRPDLGVGVRRREDWPVASGQS